MQVLQWLMSDGTAERLVPGEVRTIAVSLSEAPQSATVRVVSRTSGQEVVTSRAATVNGVVVSYLLTIPAGGDDLLAVIFTCVIGAEFVAVAVEVPVSAD